MVTPVASTEIVKHGPRQCFVFAPPRSKNRERFALQVDLLQVLEIRPIEAGILARFELQLRGSRRRETRASPRATPSMRVFFIDRSSRSGILSPDGTSIPSRAKGAFAKIQSALARPYSPLKFRKVKPQSRINRFRSADFAALQHSYSAMHHRFILFDPRFRAYSV